MADQVLVHCTGYILKDMIADFGGQVDSSDIEAIALESAVADLPDLLAAGEDAGSVPQAADAWPADLRAWVEGWDGVAEWPGTWRSELGVANLTGQPEVVTTLLWP